LKAEAKRTRAVSRMILAIGDIILLIKKDARINC